MILDKDDNCEPFPPISLDHNYALNISEHKWLLMNQDRFTAAVQASTQNYSESLELVSSTPLIQNNGFGMPSPLHSLQHCLLPSRQPTETATTALRIILLAGNSIFQTKYIGCHHFYHNPDREKNKNKNYN